MADSVKIMPLGDSITQGFGDGNADQFYKGYRGFLYNLLMSAGYSTEFVGSQFSGVLPQAMHEGHSGRKAGFIRDRVFGYLTVCPAEVVLLHIGTNDINQLPHPHNMANIDNIVSDIGGILDEIDRYEKLSNSKITVILARIINRAGPPQDPAAAAVSHTRVSQDLRKATTTLNDAIQSMADARIATGDRLLVADFEHALSYPNDICMNCSPPNPVHPNVDGYAKMANVWFDALRRVIRDRFTPDEAFTLDVLTGLAVNHNGILEMTSVVDLEYWKPLTPITDAIFSPGAPVAMAKQNDGVLTALAVDKSGRLQVTSVGGPGIWQPPVAITKPIFKDGAPVAMARQTEGILTALAVNTDGFLMVTSVAGLGKWDKPQSIGQAVFPSGAYIAIAKQTDGILTAIAVDKFHRLVVASVPGLGTWQPPIGISQDEFLPGCPVAMAKQTDGILTALAVNQNGLLMVTSVAGIGRWDEPTGIGDPVFLPWTHVAMAKQTDGVLTAVAVDKNGRLNVTSVPGLGQWQKPVAISDAVFLPGCPVALCKQTSGVLTAIAVDKYGHLVVASVPGLGHWQKPVGITSPIFSQGAHVALTRQIDGVGLKAFLAAQPRFSGSSITKRIGQLTGRGIDPEYLDFSPFGLRVLNDTWSHGVPGVDLGANTEWQDKLVFFFGDVFAKDDPDWVAFHSGRTDPWFGFPLTSVNSGSTYSPFTIQGIGSLGNAQTPTGAFSHPGKGSDGRIEQAFVFAYCNIPGKGFGSILVKSNDPTQPTDFNQVFPFSTFAPDSRRFFQVAPLVIDNSKFPNVFPSNQGDGLVMMGHGGPTNSVHAAWMPLNKGEDPDSSTILFFSGSASTPAWSPNEKDATTLFSSVGQTSLSLAWLPDAQRWLLLYTLASPGAVPLNFDPRAPMQHNPNGPVVARLGVTPWDWSDEIIVFDPLRDNALSRFMHRPGDRLNDTNLPAVQPVLPVDYDTAYGGNASFAYGAYLLNRYTKWDSIGRDLTIYYLLSTGRPYQVHLMTSHFEIPSTNRRRRHP